MSETTIIVELTRLKLAVKNHVTTPELRITPELLDASNKLQQLALRYPKYLQEVLNVRFAMHFLDTFHVHDGHLSTTLEDLQKITLFAETFQHTIQTLVEVKIVPTSDVMTKEQALQVFAIAFTAYAKVMALFSFPQEKTYNLVVSSNNKLSS
jgi:hypothetical protein